MVYPIHPDPEINAEVAAEMREAERFMAEALRKAAPSMDPAAHARNVDYHACIFEDNHPGFDRLKFCIACGLDA